MNQTQPVVAIVRCDSYEAERVTEAVQSGIELLGGASRFAMAGERILLKPNILSGADPARCIGPHPLVFRAVALVFKSIGAELSFGDSPGFGHPKSNAKKAGYMPYAEEVGVAWANFSTGREIAFPQGRVIKKFSIAAGVADSHGLISLSKLKTHALTRITGAIKNQFGCIPGARKAEFHSVMPTVAQFSQMLVDINLCLQPRLHVMDAVMSMEGNGPHNGTPRAMRALIFSQDAVALDATVCRMIALDPKLVDTLVYGQQFGLGSMQNIQYRGDDLASFIAPDFIVNRSPQKSTTDTSFLATGFMRRFSAPRPTIQADACTRCGRCVQVCPAQPKALAWGKDGKEAPPIYDYAKCIRCYCCQELCPAKAIFVKTPPLGRLIRS